MKTYITDIFEKLKNYSKKLDDLALLTDKHWVLFDHSIESKIVYIFQKSGILLISVNGNITKSKWEYLGNSSLLIDIGEKSYLYKKGFFDNNILAIKVDGINEYAILLDEYNSELTTINNITFLEHFLKKKYIDNNYLSFQKDILIENNEYRIIDGFHENYAVIINDDLNYGFLNEEKQIVKKCVFEFAENFSCGLALVRENNKFGYLDKSFKYVIKPIYDNAASFINFEAKVKVANRTFTINTLGEIIN